MEIQSNTVPLSNAEVEAIVSANRTIRQNHEFGAVTMPQPVVKLELQLLQYMAKIGNKQRHLTDRDAPRQASGSVGRSSVDRASRANLPLGEVERISAQDGVQQSGSGMRISKRQGSSGSTSSGAGSLGNNTDGAADGTTNKLSYAALDRIVGKLEAVSKTAFLPNKGISHNEAVMIVNALPTSDIEVLRLFDETVEHRVVNGDVDAMARAIMAAVAVS